MMRGGLILAPLAIALLACAPQEQAQQPSAPAEPAAPETPAPSAPAYNAADDVPRIYMSLQPDPNGSTSVVFAIDQGRDDTPLNDAAIRLTPEEGQCNPQELRGYPFPAANAQRPVFGPQEARSGVTARELPNFMAMAVTSEMMRQGLIVEPQQSKPQKVCTRKLWEQLVLKESAS